MWFRILILFFIFQSAFASEKISIDLQHAPLQDAIHILAEKNNLNVVLSPNIQGEVNVHLKDSSAAEAFENLLSAQHLTKWKNGNAWYIGTQEEFIQRKQDELKAQNAINETAVLATRIWQIHYAKADELARLLQDGTNSLLSARGHVRVDMRTNSLCVQDVPDRIAEIEKLIQRLDVPVKQVLIKTRLVSIDSDFERELGVNFNVQSNTANATVNTSQAFSSGNHFSIAVAQLADGSLLDVKLSALENEGHGELISTPSLFTGNQQTASIESGEEIPYQETTASGATSVAFKKAVLSLKVTPQILPDNNVMLQLQVNQDKPSNRIVLGVPAISTRQMNTTILMKNGQTIVLGGIYEVEKEDEAQQIPFLGKIPLVGLLFSQHNSAQRKRELLIFVTPKIC